ncbi:MAG: prepilin-type N-terminal cleavage/methylation domain-containing protein [Candidatus Magasanikbacteria bacterium]
MKNLSIFLKNKKAFSLLEAIISIAIFAIFASAIYTGIQYVYKVIYISRVQIIETDILNEQIEIIRNMDFLDIGIVSSTPVGILTRNTLITRDKIDFLIIRSIRNIDDPSDGTIDTGTDVNANDYRLVFLEVQCTSCIQANPLTFSTYVSDSFPEDTSNSGALFVNVKDSNNNPVQGATVHVYSNDPEININMDDTTDNDGILRIYNLQTCYKCYEITVTKNNLTTDKTYAISDFASSTPINEHITINAQQVSNSYFQIDTPTQVVLKTLDVNCIPVTGVDFGISGGGLIASDVDVPYFQDNFTTDVNGEYNFTNLHWGDYAFTVNNYNYIGSVPAQPINILANSSKNINLMVASSTTSSFSMLVLDGDTQLPISNAKVTLTSGVTSSVNYTGFGFIQQNDWSGLSSHQFYDVSHGFWSNSNTEYDTTNHPFGIKLTLIGTNLYATSGNLESATFDFGSTDVSYTKIDWQPNSQPDLTGVDPVLFQIATSATSTPDHWDYLGPDGSPNTYYSLTNQNMNSVHNGQRYLRYKVYLHSDDYDVVLGGSRYTPTISEVNIFYVKSCSAPGQVYFDNIPVSTGNTITIEADGYEIKNITDVTIDSNITTTTDLISL